jgi:hypothetical protein
MQPNGKPHVLVLRPISLIIHKAASEPTQEKKLIIKFKVEKKKSQQQYKREAVFTFKIISGGIQLTSSSYNFPRTWNSLKNMEKGSTKWFEAGCIAKEMQATYISIIRSIDWEW